MNEKQNQNKAWLLADSNKTFDYKQHLKTNIKCVICGAKARTPDLSGVDPTYGPFQIEICSTCGVYSYDKTPTLDLLNHYYAGESEGRDSAKPGSLTAYLRNLKLQAYVMKLLAPLITANGGNKDFAKQKIGVLDYGTGDGILASCFADQPEVSSVVAIDLPNEAPKIFADNKKISYSSVENFNTGSSQEKFDIIILRHVLEHILDPISLLTQLDKVRAENGRFIIEVPAGNTPWKNIFGAHYCQLAYPGHIHLFNHSSLLRIFPDSEVVNVNVPVIGASLGAAIGLNASRIGLTSAFFYPLQILMDRFIFRKSTALLCIASQSPVTADKATDHTS